jgi:hypothetical protein
MPANDTPLLVRLVARKQFFIVAGDFSRCEEWIFSPSGAAFPSTLWQEKHLSVALRLYALWLAGRIFAVLWQDAHLTGGTFPPRASDGRRPGNSSSDSRKMQNVGMANRPFPGPVGVGLEHMETGTKRTRTMISEERAKMKPQRREGVRLRFGARGRRKSLSLSLIPCGPFRPRARHGKSGDGPAPPRTRKAISPPGIRSGVHRAVRSSSA